MVPLRRRPPDECPLEEAPAAWEDGLVLVCSKCSGQQPGASGPQVMPSWDSWTLRGWLKERLKAAGAWPRTRVVTTSCLGVCRDGKITVALGSEAAGDGPRCLVVDPERDAEALLEWIQGGQVRTR